jgi:hypothetical protein
MFALHVCRCDVDAGYRGHNAPPDYQFKVYTSKQKRRLNSALEFQGGAAWRKRLNEDIGDQVPVTRLSVLRAASVWTGLESKLRRSRLLGACATQAVRACRHRLKGT